MTQRDYAFTMRIPGSGFLISILLLASTTHCGTGARSDGTSGSGSTSNGSTSNGSTSNGSTSNGSTSNGVPVSATSVADKDAFLDSYVASFCKVVARCTPDDAILLTQADCEADRRANAQSEQVWNDTQVLYDAAAGRRCIEAINALGCKYASGNDVESNCNVVFYGSGAANGSCSIDEHCQVGLYCDQSLGCPGSCQRRPQQGEPCPNYACAVGLSCIERGDGSGPQCETLGAEGVACGRQLRDCQADFLCEAPEGEGGFCRTPEQALPPASLGETCRVNLQCSSDQFCSRAPEMETGVCAMRLSEDAACETQYACAAGLFCRELLFDAGSCVAQSLLGDSCDEAENSQCAVGDCHDSSCQLRAAIGASCTEDWACHSYYCASGVCAQEPACD